MNADGLENLVGCVSREEGHEHVLQNRLLTIMITIRFIDVNKT